MHSTIKLTIIAIVYAALNLTRFIFFCFGAVILIDLFYPFLDDLQSYEGRPPPELSYQDRAIWIAFGFVWIIPYGILPRPVPFRIAFSLLLLTQLPLIGAGVVHPIFGPPAEKWSLLPMSGLILLNILACWRARSSFLWSSILSRSGSRLGAEHGAAGQNGV